MEPQVFFSVCYNDKAPAKETQARHTFVPAVLRGYCRRRVCHADYPGMIEDPDHSVFGMVVSGITKANLERLDYLSVEPPSPPRMLGISTSQGLAREESCHAGPISLSRQRSGLPTRSGEMHPFSMEEMMADPLI